MQTNSKKSAAVIAQATFKEYNKKAKDTFSSVNILMDPLVLLLCEDNRSYVPPLPLVKITLDQAQISFNVKQESFEFEHVLSAFDFYNKKTDEWDMIIEPIVYHLSYRKSVKTRDEQYNINIKSPFNINLSHDMISSFTSFYDLITKYTIDHQQTYSESPKCIIYNKTNVMCDITIPNDPQKVITLGPGDFIPLYNVNRETHINCCIGNKVRGCFSLHQLAFPVFPAGMGYVVYKKHENNSTAVYISTTLLFNNQTNKNFYIYHRQNDMYKPIVKIAPSDYTAIPINIPHDSTFVLCSGEARGQRHAQFTLKKLKAPQSINVFVDSHPFPVLLHRQLDPQRGACVVNIMCPIRLTNNLPFPAIFKVSSITYTIKRNETINAEYLMPATSTMDVSVTLPDKQISSVSQVPLKNDELRAIRVSKDGQFLYNIAASVAIDEKTGQATVSFYIPAVFFNTTNLPLSLSDKEYKVRNAFVPVKDSDYSITLWGLDSYFADNASQLTYLLMRNERKRSLKPIDTILSNVDEPILIPMQEDQNGFIPLHYAIRTNPNERMSMVTISYHITIKNNLDEAIRLQSVTEFSKKEIVFVPSLFEPRTEKPLMVCSQFFNYFLLLADYLPTEISLANPIHTTIRVKKLNSTFLLINLLVVQTPVGITVTFSPVSDHEPIMITNSLDNEPIAVCQSIDTFPIIIDSNETKPFAFNYPERNNDIYISVYGEVIKVSLQILNLPMTHKFNDGKDAVIEVRTTKEGSKVIYVMNRKNEVTLPQRFTITLDIPKLCVSLIDERLRELALLTFHALVFQYDTCNNLNNVSFSIKSFQLDDMYPDVPLPVILYAHPKDTDSFLKYNASFYSTAAFAQAFKDFELKIAPITCYLDINFVSELMSFFISATQVQTENAPIEPLKTSKTSSVTLSFEHFRLNTINIIVSVRPHTTRVRQHPYFNRYLTLVPSITNAPIVLAGTSFKQMDLTSNYIREKILQRYKKSLIDQIMKLLGHSDLLFNFSEIGNIFQQNIEHISQGDIDKVKPGAILTGAESIVRNTSTLIHSYIEGDANQAGGLNRSAAETFGDGFVSFGRGIAKGFAGIVTKPMEESKKGISAGIKGGIMGVVGAVASPVSGLLDIGAGLIGGTKKLITQDNFTVEPERIPRAFLMNRIYPAVEEANRAQIALETYDLIGTTYNETLVFFMRSKCEYVGISQMYMWMLRGDLSVRERIKLAKIERITEKDKTLIIEIKSVTKQKIVIETKSNEIAKQALQIIVSNSMICKTNSNF